jgi:hypothetical protein
MLKTKRLNEGKKHEVSQKQESGDYHAPSESKDSIREKNHVGTARPRLSTGAEPTRNHEGRVKSQKPPKMTTVERRASRPSTNETPVFATL